MEYLSSMPFSNKVYFSQNDLKVFGLLISLLLNIYMIIKYCRLNSLNENMKFVRSNIKEWEKYE